MSKKRPNSIYTALRIPSELREQAMEKATRDGRSLSNYIKHLIREDLNESAPALYRIPVRYSKVRIQTEAIVITDTNGRVTKINRAFTKMCGYTFKDLYGEKPGKKLQGPATEKDVVRAFSKAIKAVKPFNCTLTNYDKKQRLYHVEIQMRPIFDGTKHVGFEAVERRLD